MLIKPNASQVTRQNPKPQDSPVKLASAEPSLPKDSFTFSSTKGSDSHYSGSQILGRMAVGAVVGLSTNWFVYQLGGF